MALELHDGFENSLLTAWATSSGAVSVGAAYAHTGGYGLRVNPSADLGYLGSGVTGVMRATFYLKIISAPDADAQIIGGTAAPGATVVTLRLTTTRTIDLYVSTTKRVAGTTQLDLNTWYRISVSVNGTTHATKFYINGIEEGSYSDAGLLVTGAWVGVSYTACTTDLYFDDFAFDKTNSTDDLGDIRTLGARPVGEGTDQNTGTGVDWQDPGNQPATYDHIDSDPPNTTDYDWAEADGGLMSYTVALDECGSGNLVGIGGSDEILAVNFMCYYKTGGGSPNEYYKVTYDQGARIQTSIDDPTVATWLQSYEVDCPSDGDPWTQTNFNTVEMGMATDDANKDLWFYEAYAMVAFKVASGPQQYDRTVTDAIGITDSRSAVAQFLRAIAESIGLTDAKSASVGLPRTINDSLGLTDAETSVLALLRTLSDSLGLADATTMLQQILRSFDESLGLTDARTVLANFSRTLTESLGVSDSVTAVEAIYIHDVYELQAMEDNLSGHYVLANDIDCSAADPTSGNWDSDEWPGTTGFRPIGDDTTPFSGSLDGAGYKISNLYINRPSTWEVALFGWTENATLSDVVIEGADITGYKYVGILCGNAYSSNEISDCSTAGAVAGNDDYVGGLIGSDGGSTITDCFSSAAVDGASFVGGLIGEATSGTLTRCRATGTVTGTADFVGGLIGEIANQTLSLSFAQGNVSADYDAGGLVGYVEPTANIENCYATGNVSASTSGAGGLIGQVTDSAQITVSKCYSVGSVSGTNSGGLIGVGGNNPVVVDSFWDTQTSGKASSAGGTGKTTSEMKDVATYTDTDTEGLDNPWDFVGNPYDDTGDEDYWDIGTPNNGYPYLTWQSLGASYVRTIDDGIGVGDQTALVKEILRTFDDGIGVADDRSRTAEALRSLSESLGLSDEALKSFGTVRTVADSLGLSDETLRVAVTLRILSDSLDLTDVPAKSLGLNRVLPDTVGLTDQPTKAFDATRILSEALNLTDSTGKAENKILSDSVGLADETLRVALILRILSESLGLTDLASRITALNRIVVDAVGLTDSLSRDEKKSLAEQMGVTDSASRLYVAVKTVIDSVGLTDDMSRVWALLRTLDDQLGITDAMQYEAPGAIIRIINNEIGLSDQMSRLSTVLRVLAETLNLSDALQRVFAVSRVVSDSEGLTDSIALDRLMSIADSLGLTDSVVRLIDYLRTQADTVGALDALVHVQAVIRTMDDSVGITDEAHEQLGALVQAAWAFMVIRQTRN